MLHIPYESNGFPGGTVPNGISELSVTWDDILWAAVTVGRPDRYYVFRHGDTSIYEAIFRWSLVRMALEQSGPGGYRLCRTNAAKTLDPTEKGAVNYFLGMIICKLFASKLLYTPWLLHLDVFGSQLNALLKKRSRPDLVGLELGMTRWHSFECKGRISPPDSTTKLKAKEQAQQILSVDGTECSLHVGAITYFRNDILHFYWRDPVPDKKKAIDVPYYPRLWKYYYAPIIETIKSANREALQAEAGALVTLKGVEVEVGIHPAIASYLFSEKWESAQRAAAEATTEIIHAGYQPDGIMIKAGAMWCKRFKGLDSKEE